MEERTVFVVWGRSGEYSDSSTWVAGIFTDEADAKAWVALAEKATEKYRKANERSKNWYGEQQERAAKEFMDSTGAEVFGVNSDNEYGVYPTTIDALKVYLSHGSPAPTAKEGT